MVARGIQIVFCGRAPNCGVGSEQDDRLSLPEATDLIKHAAAPVQQGHDQMSQRSDVVHAAWAEPPVSGVSVSGAEATAPWAGSAAVRRRVCAQDLRWGLRQIHFRPARLAPFMFELPFMSQTDRAGWRYYVTVPEP